MSPGTWQDAINKYPPMCSKCKAPVSYFSASYDPVLLRITLRAECHGQVVHSVVAKEALIHFGKKTLDLFNEV